jgi:hypothetical protein
MQFSSSVRQLVTKSQFPNELGSKAYHRELLPPLPSKRFWDFAIWLAASADRIFLPWRFDDVCSHTAQVIAGNFFEMHSAHVGHYRCEPMAIFTAPFLQLPLRRPPNEEMTMPANYIGDRIPGVIINIIIISRLDHADIREPTQRGTQLAFHAFQVEIATIVAREMPFVRNGQEVHRWPRIGVLNVEELEYSTNIFTSPFYSRFAVDRGQKVRVA